ARARARPSDRHARRDDRSRARRPRRRRSRTRDHALIRALRARVDRPAAPRHCSASFSHLDLTTKRASMPLKTRLFTPGPVEIPPRILRALSQVPPHHRTDVFRDTLRRVTDRLRTLHGTEGEVFLFAGSGTSAMEAAVVNVVAPGEKSLAIAGGKFGERWARILEAYGQAVETLEMEWGQSVDPAEVERRLDADPAIRLVFATHSETSTGAFHDVEAIAKITRPRGVRLVVDAVTSLGVHPVLQDAWGVDVMVC